MHFTGRQVYKCCNVCETWYKHASTGIKYTRASLHTDQNLNRRLSTAIILNYTADIRTLYMSKAHVLPLIAPPRSYSTVSAPAQLVQIHGIFIKVYSITVRYLDINSSLVLVKMYLYETVIFHY